MFVRAEALLPAQGGDRKSAVCAARKRGLLSLFPKACLTSTPGVAIHGAGDQTTQPGPPQVGLNPLGNRDRLVRIRKDARCWDGGLGR